MSIYSEPQYPVKVRVYSSAVHPLIVLLKEAEPVPLTFQLYSEPSEPERVRVPLISVEVEIALIVKVHFTDELVENVALMVRERISL